MEGWAGQNGGAPRFRKRQWVPQARDCQKGIGRIPEGKGTIRSGRITGGEVFDANVVCILRLPSPEAADGDDVADLHAGWRDP